MGLETWLPLFLLSSFCFVLLNGKHTAGVQNGRKLVKRLSDSLELRLTVSLALRGLGGEVLRSPWPCLLSTAKITYLISYSCRFAFYPDSGSITYNLLYFVLLNCCDFLAHNGLFSTLFSRIAGNNIQSGLILWDT